MTATRLRARSAPSRQAGTGAPAPAQDMAGHMVDSDVMIYTEHVHRYLLLDHSATGTGNGTRASAHARDALGMPSELAPRRRRWGERADEEMRPWWTVAEVAAALLETAAAARRGLGLTRTEPLQPLEPWAPKHAIAFVLVPLRPRDGWLKSAPAGAGGQSHLPSGKRAQTSACLLRPLRSLCAANSGRHVVHTVLAVQQGFPALRATSHYPQLGCTALVPGTASAGLANTSPAAFTGTCCRSSLRAPRRHNALANLSGSLCSVTLSSSNVMEPEHAGSPCARSSKLCLLHLGPRSGAVTLMPNSAKKKKFALPFRRLGSGSTTNISLCSKFLVAYRAPAACRPAGFVFEAVTDPSHYICCCPFLSLSAQFTYPIQTHYSVLSPLASALPSRRHNPCLL